LKRAYANREPGRKPKPSERRAKNQDTRRQIQLSLDRDELLALMQDSLEGLTVEIGLLVASAILEDEVSRLCGARYQHKVDRTQTRYGRQQGVVVIGGQKLPIERPRVRASWWWGRGSAGDLRASPIP
jgi:hypothetical protein